MVFSFLFTLYSFLLPPHIKKSPFVMSGDSFVIENFILLLLLLPRAA